MFGRFLKSAGIFVVASVILVGAGQAFAAQVPGSGPESAFTVPAGPVNIPAGGELWFAFNYAGDKSQINVDMSGNFEWSGHRRPAMQLTIWTPDNVKTRSMGQAVTPVGAGTVNASTNNPDQVWSGSFNTPGTYYLVVNQNPEIPGSFQLKIAGSGVSGAGQPMPSPTAAASPAPAVASPGT